MYNHKLLTIGDLTHLLRWNYGVDLELENVCFRADKGSGRKEKGGTKMGRGENRGEHVLTERDWEETATVESHRKPNGHKTVISHVQSNEPTQD